MSPHYLVLKPLGEQLEAAATELREEKLVLRVLDIGCGPKPYEPFFTSKTGAYWGLDITMTSKADVVGTMERLPICDGALDAIVCTQVFQSCRQPMGALTEMWRVLRPSGVLLLSTPGTWLRDPGTPDYWRWTDEGLRLASEEAGYDVVEILPNGGVVACLTYLIVNALSGLSYQRRFLAPVRWLLVPLLNVVGQALDGTVTRLRPLSQPLLVGNYLLVARRPVSLEAADREADDAPVHLR